MHANALERQCLHWCRLFHLVLLCYWFLINPVPLERNVCLEQGNCQTYRDQRDAKADMKPGQEQGQSPRAIAVTGGTVWGGPEGDTRTCLECCNEVLPPNWLLNTSSAGANWGRRGLSVLWAGLSSGKESLKCSCHKHRQKCLVWECWDQHLQETLRLARKHRYCNLLLSILDYSRSWTFPVFSLW